MANKDRNRSNFPALLALVSLVLLILLLGYYFANCFTKQLSMVPDEDSVLGVSTFSSSSSKNPVTNGETFNFAATIVGDQAGLLNATVLFSLTGQGVIGSNIQGPGACFKVTDTTAACNNVNVDPNETIVWSVPVTVSSTCSQQSPATLSLQTRLVSTLVTSSSTATVNCAAPSATTPPSSNGSGTGTTPPVTTGGNRAGTQSGTTNKASGNTNGSAAVTKPTNFDFAGLACSKVNGIPLVFILIIVWIILAAYYFIFRRE